MTYQIHIQNQNEMQQKENHYSKDTLPPQM